MPSTVPHKTARITPRTQIAGHGLAGVDAGCFCSYCVRGIEDAEFSAPIPHKTTNFIGIGTIIEIPGNISTGVQAGGLCLCRVGAVENDKASVAVPHKTADLIAVRRIFEIPATSPLAFMLTAVVDVASGASNTTKP